MRILGIDPGIGRTGWGIIEERNGTTTALNYDCCETSAKLPISDRLLEIHRAVTKVIETHKPGVLVVEELFFNTNAKTALTVGQARGVVLLAGVQKRIPLAVYTPLQVKIAVTGYGRAGKSQIGHMVKTILKLSEIPKPDDTADALAICLTHAFSKRMNINL